MDKKYKVIFYLYILLGMQTVIAEESEDGKVMQPETTSEAQQPAPTQPRNDNSKPLEEFVPSEEISADRSVTFPVDI